MRAHACRCACARVLMRLHVCADVWLCAFLCLCVLRASACVLFLLSNFRNPRKRPPQYNLFDPVVTTMTTRTVTGMMQTELSTRSWRKMKRSGHTHSLTHSTERERERESVCVCVCGPKKWMAHQVLVRAHTDMHILTTEMLGRGAGSSKVRLLL
jgi:hypothetical protein